MTAFLEWSEYVLSFSTVDQPWDKRGLEGSSSAGGEPCVMREASWLIIGLAGMSGSDSGLLTSFVG